MGPYPKLLELKPTHPPCVGRGEGKYSVTSTTRAAAAAYTFTLPVAESVDSKELNAEV
jgi:hypothetical protein